MGQIEYQIGSPDSVDAKELLAFYQGQRHITSASPEKLRSMLDSSHCFVTAREDGRLIGIARGLTDGVRGYLAECKLDPALQGPAAVTRTDGRIEHDERGIARQLARCVLDSLRELGVERIDVIAHSTEEDFCSELGFVRASAMITMQLDPKTIAVSKEQSTGNGAEADARRQTPAGRQTTRLPAGLDKSFS